MIGIYRITERASGKVYIGQSSKIESRWLAHARGRFPRAQYDYAVEQECCLGMLDLLERFFIMKYKSISPWGLNEQVNSYNQFRRSTNWDKKRQTLSERAKQQWSEKRDDMLQSMSDRKTPPPKTAETRALMSAQQTGKRRSEASRLKSSVSAKNRRKKDKT
jgi:hypothetical protein